jgi:hypothetical protein
MFLCSEFEIRSYNDIFNIRYKVCISYHIEIELLKYSKYRQKVIMKFYGTEVGNEYVSTSNVTLHLNKQEPFKQ